MDTYTVIVNRPGKPLETIDTGSTPEAAVEEAVYRFWLDMGRHVLEQMTVQICLNGAVIDTLQRDETKEI